MVVTNLVTMFVLVLLIVTGLPRWQAQGETKRETIERKVIAVPRGSVQPTVGFSVSYSIVPRLKLEERPVKIVGMVEDVPSMSKLKIENVSGREVQAIKFRWYLFDDEASKSYVKHGETDKIKVNHLAPQSSMEVETKLPTFDDMFKSLSKNGLISGQYYVEAVVAEVGFADGTKWQLKQE